KVADEPCLSDLARAAQDQRPAFRSAQPGVEGRRRLTKHWLSCNNNALFCQLGFRSTAAGPRPERHVVWSFRGERHEGQWDPEGTVVARRWVLVFSVVMLGA